MKWFLIWGWELYNFSPVTATDVKQVLPIMYFCDSFSFAAAIFHFWCF